MYIFDKDEKNNISIPEDMKPNSLRIGKVPSGFNTGTYGYPCDACKTTFFITDEYYVIQQLRGDGLHGSRYLYSVGFVCSERCAEFQLFKLM